MRNTKYSRAAGTISSIVLATILAVLLVLQIPAAHAGENRIGIDLKVTATDGDDYSILAADVEVDARDAGDISVFAAEVDIKGNVLGDVSIFAAEISIDGDIGGDLSAAGAEVNVTSNVGGEVSLAGAEVHFAGSGDDVNLAGDDVYLDGTVNGDLHVGTDNFYVTADTVITGNFEFRGQHEPTLPEGLTIGGTYSYKYVDFDDVLEGDLHLAMFPIVALVGIVGALALMTLLPFAVLIGAGVLLLMTTGLTARTIDGMRQRPFASIGMGIVVLIGLMVIAVLLCVTVIGIPLALAILWFYPVLILVGFIIAILGVPYLVLKRDPGKTGAGMKLGLFFISVVALLVLFAIPLIGQLLFALIVLMGVGAFGAALLGGRNDQTA